MARLITLVENEDPAAREALVKLYPHTGRAHIVGVTGAPGCGKSTLVNQIAKQIRQNDDTVGIVAVDPTSPFSGGAVLGDRIRMRDLFGDQGIFIRSMASRGSLGGLARNTGAVVKLLDAAGFDTILIETVGAGQSEVDIAKGAHSTIVVQAPGMGDDIQAIKAGILEIADIFVVNKADQPGAESTVKALQMMQRLGSNGNEMVRRYGRLFKGESRVRLESEPGWDVPVLQAVSIDGTGVREIVDTISAHRDYLHDSGEFQLREAARVESEFVMLLRDALLDDLLDRVPVGKLENLLDQLVAREIDPYSAVEDLVSVR